MKQLTQKVWIAGVVLFIMTTQVLRGQDLFSGTYKGMMDGLELPYPLVIESSGNGQYRLDAGGVILEGRLSGNQIMGTSSAFTVRKNGAIYELEESGIRIQLVKTSAGPQMENNFNAVQKNEATTMQGNNTEKVSPSGSTSKGPKVTDKQNGYSYNAPAGWTETTDGNGGYVYIKGSDQQHLLILSSHQYTSVQQVLQEAAKPQQVEQISIEPVGQARRYGDNGVFASYRGNTQGQSIHFQTITLVSPHGGGILLACLTVGPHPSSELLEVSKSVANSVSFSKPTVSGLAAEWTGALRGRQLLYMKTGNGLSTKTSYDLCADGSFVYINSQHYNSSNFTDNFNANTADNGNGTWKVMGQGQQVTLVFSFSDGSIRQFALTNEDDKIFLNGTKYFLENAAHCR